MNLSMLTTGLALLLAGTTVDKPAKCPISGKPADPEIRLFSEGKNLAFCCTDCRKEFISTRENRLSKKQQKEGWKLLFGGKNLGTFQKPTRAGKWSAKDGKLVGEKGPGALGTIARYDNFELQVDARIHDTGGKKRGNSGIFIRSTGMLAYRGRWPDGYEVQMDHGDPKYWTGALFKTAAAKKVKTKDGDWFQLRVEARGKRIRVWIDGKLVTDYKEAREPVVKGPISFQVHHPTSIVELKNVKIRPLTDRSKK